MIDYVRFKRHKHISDVNGNKETDNISYEFIFHPFEKHDDYMNEFSEWLKQYDCKYSFDKTTRKIVGVNNPEKGRCWCSYMGSFLGEKGFIPWYSSSFDSAEIFIKVPDVLIKVFNSLSRFLNSKS